MTATDSSSVEILTILTTNTCTAECAHCCMNSNKQRRGRISVDEAKESIRGARNLGAKLIVFAGGEPTLLKSDLLKMIAYANSLGLHTRVVTNASWAITKAKARELQSKLVDSGLNEINISYDDFHLPYIKNTHLINAFESSIGIGFSAFVFTLCTTRTSIVDAQYVKNLLGVDLPIIRTNGYLKDFEWYKRNGTNYGISISALARLGQAKTRISADQISEMSSNQIAFNSPCRISMRDIAVTPDNHLTPCCGTEFAGNEFMDLGMTKTLEETYATSKELGIVRLLTIAGPNFIQKLVDNDSGENIAASEGTSMSICEICERLFSDSRNTASLRRLESTGYFNIVADRYESRIREKKHGI